EYKDRPEFKAGKTEKYYLNKRAAGKNRDNMDEDRAGNTAVPSEATASNTIASKATISNASASNAPVSHATDSNAKKKNGLLARLKALFELPRSLVERNK
ncbi:hypothetical protein, partial [Hungatella sp. SL.1.14]|uniref:hypothetical protein n=1 Tax=Hungatella sp. SL.1.14 TaxID=2963703 RepID=UPI00210EC45A